MGAQPGFEPGIPCIRGKPPKASILPLDHWATLIAFFSPYIGIRRQRMGNTSSTELSMEQERLLDCDVPHVRRLHINTNQPERPWIYHLYRLSNLLHLQCLKVILSAVLLPHTSLPPPNLRPRLSFNLSNPNQSPPCPPILGNLGHQALLNESVGVASHALYVFSSKTCYPAY